MSRGLPTAGRVRPQVSRNMGRPSVNTVARSGDAAHNGSPRIMQGYLGLRSTGRSERRPQMAERAQVNHGPSITGRARKENICSGCSTYRVWSP